MLQCTWFNQPYLADKIKPKMQIVVSGKVEVVDHQTLPRTERKSKRIFDNR
jgi:phenylacetate-coenzyme A ligase PaaK-like adenylate-forming protein